MSFISTYWMVIAAAVVFFLVGWLLTKNRFEKQHGQAQLLHDRMIEDAQRESSSIVKSAELEAKEEFYQARQRFEDQTKATKTRPRQEFGRRG